MVTGVAQLINKPCAAIILNILCYVTEKIGLRIEKRKSFHYLNKSLISSTKSTVTNELKQLTKAKT